jgi:hypothetical protein
MYLSKNNLSHLIFLLDRFKLKPILDALHFAGGKCFFVGGTVRDILRSSPIRDIDIEVYNLSLQQVQAILSEFEFVEEIGKSFGVFKIRGGTVDVSLPRTDSSPGRKPYTDVLSSLTVEKALLRRDLTINSIALDLLSYELRDPYGGIGDIFCRRLRSVDESFFTEDPLRFWRVFQFIGRFESLVDEKLSVVCRYMNLSALPFERVEQELLKWATFSTVSAWSIEWLLKINRADLLGSAFLSGENLQDLVQAFEFFDSYIYASPQEKIVIHFCVLVYYGADLNFLTRANRIKKSVKRLIELSRSCINLNDYLIAAPLLCSVDLTPRTLIFFSRAVGMINDSNMKYFYESLLNRKALYFPVEPIVKSDDLMSLGYSGVDLGKKLREAYAIQVSQNIEAKNIILEIVTRAL